MGRLGYQSDAQSELHISYNSLAEYTTTMRAGLSKSFPDTRILQLMKTVTISN